MLRSPVPGVKVLTPVQLTFQAMAASRAFLQRPEGGAKYGSHGGLLMAHAQAKQAPLVQSERLVEEDYTSTILKLRESEELGTKQQTSCSTHRNCPGCRNPLEHLTPKERDMIAIMESGLSVEDGKVTVQYPCRPCLESLENNYGQARAVQSSLEAGLKASGRHKAFTREIEKALTEGTFSLVTRREIRERLRANAICGPLQGQATLPCGTQTENRSQQLLNKCALQAFGERVYDATT